VVGDVGDGAKDLEDTWKKLSVFFIFFIGSILCCSESGDDDTQENLARYGYNLNTKLENLK